MKTLTLTLIKKNRVYFACKLSNGHDCNLKINDISKDLELGEHEILAKDISVRSKYGTKLIFEPVGEVKADSYVFLRHPAYNKNLVDECKMLGGKWDKEEAIWAFSDIVQDKVEELDEIYNSAPVSVEIKAKEDIYAGPDKYGVVTFCGYQIAKATDRDSGATLRDGISLIEGEITSGGSVKNWVCIVKESTVMRLKVPRLLLEKERETFEELYEIKILGK